MKYISDEKIGKKISKIGLGTARMGTRYSKNLSFEMMDVFFEHGGNCLDTARTYSEWVENGRGKSEECIGKWMLQRKNRDKMCIVTKGGTSGRGCVNVNLTESGLTEDVKESLDALITDYIDVYLLHRDDPGMEVAEIVENLQKVKEIGKIKCIGVSNWSLKRLEAANVYAQKHGMCQLQAIENWWSLAEYKFEMWNDETTTHMDDEMLDYIEKRDMLAFAMTSQCRGFFQKAISEGLESIDSFLKQRIVTTRNINKMKFIKEYCEINHIDVSAFVSGYITSHKQNGVALVSCSSISQLLDVVNNADYVLPQEVIQKINSI